MDGRASDIRDVCIGLFGIQVVWGLQTANTSRIFQTLGADIATLPVLWDRKTGSIVSNESADIVRMLNDGFGDLGRRRA